MKKRKILTFRTHLKQSLKDPEFRKAWKESEAEYRLAKALSDKRLEMKMSQQELASKVKTSQARISFIESMQANPSLSLLKRIAGALDSELVVDFK